jgi:hypothetical protein
MSASVYRSFALLPMAFAAAGATLDELGHQGFSIWRSACRAAGLSVSSLLVFTFELLPMAVLGALLGGLVVQYWGLQRRRRAGTARASLAAHGGCFLGMAAGLPLCALPVPLPGALAAEALIAVAGAALVHRLLRPHRACAASGMLPTRSVPSA